MFPSRRAARAGPLPERSRSAPLKGTMAMKRTSCCSVDAGAPRASRLLDRTRKTTRTDRTRPGGAYAFGRRAGRGTRFEPGCGDAVRFRRYSPYAEGLEETPPMSLPLLWLGLTGRGLRAPGRSPRRSPHYKGVPSGRETAGRAVFRACFKTERSEFGIPPRGGASIPSGGSTMRFLLALGLVLLAQPASAQWTRVTEVPADVLFSV